MWIGLLYAVVIVVCNALGAISGMGGGVIIKPVFDVIGYDSVASVSFLSTAAVFTMSIVSTISQVSHGIRLQLKMVLWLAVGALAGGLLGERALTGLLATLGDAPVLAIQITLTILTILFALLNSVYHWGTLALRGAGWVIACGILLGFLASLLGIGGGPINVALLMLLFNMPIKAATVYSIATIFFSQLAKLASIAVAGRLGDFDLGMLWFIIPAAIIGGLLGAHFSHVLSPAKVTRVFQLMLVAVIVINLYNGVMLVVR
ncbi:sulfite exporter TauE/SafE family protein [Lacticaseibacillus mingshuiensis]|uniref:sulfite exporter TauE/SafE family protein n=1 Tax=Lacticaseibacillus mingshuiensis TaxID=2799574 RepID=UPI00195099D9|nr:sulfite exporter TauE/SafE family protein [Lacticaseibacillus mingshuiensis]